MMYRRVPTLYVQCCIALAAPKTAGGSSVRLLMAGWLVFGEKSNHTAKIILRLRCANDLPVLTAPHRAKGYAGGVVLRGRNPYTSLVTPSSFSNKRTTKRASNLFNYPEGRTAGPSKRRQLSNHRVHLLPIPSSSQQEHPLCGIVHKPSMRVSPEGRTAGPTRRRHQLNRPVGLPSIFSTSERRTLPTFCLSYGVGRANTPYSHFTAGSGLFSDNDAKKDWISSSASGFFNFTDCFLFGLRAGRRNGQGGVIDFLPRCACPLFLTGAPHLPMRPRCTSSPPPGTGAVV